MLVQTRTVVVETKEGRYTFVFSIHRAKSRTQHLIEPEFYTGIGVPVPCGRHYEIEVLEFPDWGELASLGLVRIHENPETKRKFVFFKERIPRLGHALRVIEVWCLASVYTILSKKGFVNLSMEYGMGNSLRYFKNQEIRIKSNTVNAP